MRIVNIDSQDIKRLIDTIEKGSSYNFSNYSEKSFNRRVEKILTDRNISIDVLIKKLENDSVFLEEIVKNITVNTTEIFRDPLVWVDIQNFVSSHFAHLDTINVWHCGCSNGLEVYSFLMLMSEIGFLNHINVFATDINGDVLKIASAGRYKYREMMEHFKNFDIVFDKDKKNEIVDKYLEINKFRDYVQINKSLVEKPFFVKHDLVSLENVFNVRFDIIFCRNLLIYFNLDLQSKVLNFLNSNLKQNGCLIIGRHEGIVGQPATLFNKLKNNIFVKKLKV